MPYIVIEIYRLF